MIKIIYLFLFIFVTSLIVYTAQYYKQNLVYAKKTEYFSDLSEKVNKQITALIEHKQAKQLSAIQQLVLEKKIINILKTKQLDTKNLKYISKKLELIAEYKDIWFQFIDNNGVTVARSWSDKKGVNLALIRDDVVSMINSPRVISSISVGNFDMTFKTMMPIYDETHNFLGFIELISNFDSISQDIEKLGYHLVLLVDKKYKMQLLYPRTGKFADGYYVANSDADARLLDLITKKGANSFISPYRSYITDDKSIVFNYALFDKKDTLMANFLLFKDLSSFDLKDVEDIKIKVDILTGIVILMSMFGFYFLTRGYVVIAKLDKTFYLLLAVFLVIYLLYFALVFFYYKDQEDFYMKDYNNNIKINFENITNRYSSMADIIYETKLDKRKIISALQKAQDKSQKDEAREELYEYLKDDYELFKKFGVRQLHFHLSNNESFLRFHRPSMYGDDLTNIRQTVKWVNEYHEKVQGFEEGRVYNGFRYIFPIFDEYDTSNKFYLGSVEISFSSFNFIWDLSELYKFKSTFLIKTDIVDTKLFENQKSNYVQSFYKGWSFDKAVSEKLKNLSLDADLLLIDPKQYAYIENKIAKGDIFSVDSRDNTGIFTFIPLQNPISKKVVAVFVLKKDKRIFTNLEDNLYVALLVGFILLLFVFLYIYKEISIKKQYKRLLFKTQRILDAQDSIIVIVSKDEIIDVNRKFLDFFGFVSVDGFKLHYRSISDKFLDDDRLFNINRFENRKEWIEELSKIDAKDKVVSMMDKDGKVHFFSIKDSKIENNYLLEFSDISDTMQDKFQFINKAYKDNLTGAYNRQYFDSKIEDIIHNQSYTDNLGIIFCDIDHFKNVNDRYGHDVGDLILKRVVEIIRKHIRADDIIIRWGGEEFVILVYVDAMDVLVRIANSTREAIEKEIFSKVNRLTCSFGLSRYVKGEEISKAIKRADEALYEAKQNGRNRVKFKF